MPERKIPLPYKRHVIVAAHPSGEAEDVSVEPRELRRVRGPLIKLEEELYPPSKGALTVQFVDLSSPFIRRVYTNGWAVLLYSQHYFGISSLTIPFLRTRAQLQAFSGGKNTFTSGALTDRWPLPRLHTSAFNLAFRLGGTEYALSEFDASWKEHPITDPVKLAEQVEPWISSLPTSTGHGDLWHGFSSDFHDNWWRNYAELSKLRSSGQGVTWRVVSDDSWYEGFDPFDEAQFKVTSGSFMDPAIDLSLIKVSSRQLKTLIVGLVPKFWSLSGTFVEWFYRGFSGVVFPAMFTRSGSFNDECIALTCPYVSEYDILHDPNYPGHVGTTNLMNRIEYSVGTFGTTGGIFFVNFSDKPHSTTYLTDYDGVPPSVSPFSAGSPSYSNLHTNYLMRMLSLRASTVTWTTSLVYSSPLPVEEFAAPWNLLERTSCVINISTTQTPVGALVGRFSLGTSSYYVYRKTVGALGSTVYDGPFDSLGITGGVFGINYINSLYNSFSRTFSDYDPRNFVAHISG